MLCIYKGRSGDDDSIKCSAEKMADFEKPT